jgi:hypothetical protein
MIAVIRHANKVFLQARLDLGLRDKSLHQVLAASAGHPPALNKNQAAAPLGQIQSSA